MTQEAIMNIATQTIWTIIKAAGPLLIVSLIIGLIVSIFQTVTSIQEQTLTFIPKLLGIFLTMLLLGSYILNTIVTLMERLWSNFGEYIL
ncbi:MAG: flagellar biosynthesis protein FliQ [Lachnospiraceae bacterium]|nr:flagellar biosynthesis protein FliQ [Lachnospiraceae bacterium]